ncbi:hypothetical protein HID58_063000 [Brassica napus]|uniref:Uncharacterized protein n=1 Tax=Brassica napus TaxID=3708 RepID=A0ABQ8A317_BRANA|nr:hypothetical protein HID58_063000 [Brassica napus]
MDLPEIPPFRKKDSLPCNNNHGSTAPSSTTTPPSQSNNNNHDSVGIADHNSVAPLSTTAPPPFHCNDEIFDVVPLEAPQTQLDIPHQTEDTMEEEPSLFVPSMGAWSTPLVLKFPSPCTPPEPSTPCNYDPHLVQSQIEKFWPSLDESTNFKKKKSSLKVPSSPNLPVTQLPPPELKEDGSLRFPWAARMNLAMRNLYRASRPTFRLDGTPEIIIPTKNQHVPFEFGKPVASSTDISSSPATTEFTSPQVANSHKDSPATHGNSLPNAKFTLSSTLAGTSSAHTSLQVMDDAPSEIIMDEDIILSASDPLKMTPLSTESIQDVRETVRRGLKHD